MASHAQEVTAIRMPAWTSPALAALAALSACAGATVFNPYRTHVELCPFHALTGLWCPLCGTTRALHSLFHGDAGAAWHHNPLVMASLPLLVWAWSAWTLDAIGGPRLWRLPAKRWVLVVSLALVGGFWLARNLAVPGASALGP